MRFEYNDDQRLLQESVAKFLQQEYDFEARRKTVESDVPFSAEHWQTFAELGWLSLLVSERFDGYGGSAIEVMLLFEELGKHLVLEPFVETVLQTGIVLEASADNARAPIFARLLERMMAGEFHAALAHMEPYQDDFDAPLNASATALPNGCVLNGIKAVVMNAPAAEMLFVTGMLEGEKALFAVPTSSAGIDLKEATTINGRRAADVTFNDVRVDEASLLARGAHANVVLNSALDHTLIAQVAEMLGGMQVLLSSTVDYTKQRTQFGVPLSGFQVLQHRMTDMFMATELVRSLLYAAAIKLRDNADDARLFVAAAKVKADAAARLVAQEAIQLHGGIGTTDDLKVGHYLKHFEVFANQFGSRQSHLERYRQLKSEVQVI